MDVDFADLRFSAVYACFRGYSGPEIQSGECPLLTQEDTFPINHDHEGYAGSLSPGIVAGLDKLSIHDATRLDVPRRVTAFTRRPI